MKYCILIILVLSFFPLFADNAIDPIDSVFYKQISQIEEIITSKKIDSAILIVDGVQQKHRYKAILVSKLKNCIFFDTTSIKSNIPTINILITNLTNSIYVNDSILVKSLCSASLTILSPSKPIFSKIINCEYSQFISEEDFEYILRNGDISNTYKINSERKNIFKGVIEPLVIISSAIISLILLFTIRS